MTYRTWSTHNGGMFDDLKDAAPPKKGSGLFDDLASAPPPLREKYKEQIRAAADGGKSTYEDGAPVPGFFGLLQRKMSDPFGVQDEVVGGGRYVGSLAGDLAHGRAPDWNAANLEYTKGSERVRAEKEMGRERLGWGGNLLAELVGGFGTSGAGSVMNRAATWGARALQSAKAGAQYGAVAGAGNAEGGAWDRLKGAAYGAGEGAVIAPAISEVAFPGWQRALSSRSQDAYRRLECLSIHRARHARQCGRTPS